MQFRMQKLTLTLMTTLMLAATLNATEPDMNRLIGTRAQTQSEHIENQERRLLESQKQEKEPSDDVIKKNLTTTHPDVYQYPYWVSPLGDVVELNSGTQWAVAYEDRLKTFDWMTSDKVVITPNHSWFSSYHYRLRNLNTGANVRANMTNVPIGKILYAHWIVQIDYKNNEICLEDGSIWKISFWDSAVMEKWIVYDRVIIGCNDGWFSSSYPNLLINLETLNHTVSRSIYQ